MPQGILMDVENAVRALTNAGYERPRDVGNGKKLKKCRVPNATVAMLGKASP